MVSSLFSDFVIVPLSFSLLFYISIHLYFYISFRFSHFSSSTLPWQHFKNLYFISTSNRKQLLIGLVLVNKNTDSVPAVLKALVICVTVL